MWVYDVVGIFFYSCFESVILTYYHRNLMFFPAELCENWLSGFSVIQLKKQTNLLTYSSYTPPTTRYFLVAIARRAVFKGEGVSGISPPPPENF